MKGLGAVAVTDGLLLDQRTVLNFLKSFGVLLNVIFLESLKAGGIGGRGLVAAGVVPVIVGVDVVAAVGVAFVEE